MKVQSKLYNPNVVDFCSLPDLKFIPHSRMQVNGTCFFFLLFLDEIHAFVKYLGDTEILDERNSKYYKITSYKHGFSSILLIYVVFLTICSILFSCNIFLRCIQVKI